MSDVVLAIIWVSLFLVIGAVVAVGLMARARTQLARADAGSRRQYQELAERCTAAQEQTHAEVARLTERVAALERLLREVG